MIHFLRGMLVIGLTLIFLGGAASAQTITANVKFNSDDNGDSTLTYTDRGVTTTLSNAQNAAGTAVNFAIDSNGALGLVGDGYTVDSFDISFSTDVTLDQFEFRSVPTVTEPDGDEEFYFTVSRSGGGTSGQHNILDSLTGAIAYVPGSLATLTANTVYRVDFTTNFDDGATLSQIDFSFSSLNPIPEPGTLVLLSTGLFFFHRRTRA